MPERILKPGPAAWIASVGVCVLLLILSIIALAEGVGVWFSFLFFLAAAAGLWFSWGVATGKTAWLLLDAEGFTKKTPLTTHRYSWHDVSAFTVERAGGSVIPFSRKVVGFEITGGKRITPLQQLDPAFTFLHNYDMAADHFAELLNDYRDAALKAEAQPEAQAAAGEKSSENMTQGHY